jgi:CRISPR-associated protein Cmr6
MSRRNKLTGYKIQTTTNAGLWLDRYLYGERKEPEPKPRLVQEVAEQPVPPSLYTAAYKRWQQSLAALRPLSEGAVVQAWEYRVRGRMVVGLGNEGVLETSITLQRTYGVPFIPGSALKGLAAAYARKHLTGYSKPAPQAATQQRDPDQRAIDTQPYTLLFGTDQQAGYVTFFDAWFIPGSGRSPHPDRPLWADVLTPHHPNYYMGGAPPAEWDNPIPQPFLTATGSYLVVLAGPPALVTNAQLILTWALRDLGIGGKTSSGYGRMDEIGSVTLGAASGEQRNQPPAGQANNAADQRQTGRIVRLPEGKTFGFIQPDAGGQEHFFQRKGTAAELALHAWVSYLPQQGAKGPRAIDVLPQP